MNSIVRKLKEGDLRQKGKSEEVVADVLKKPQLFRHVVAGIVDTEPGVRMRASDAAEKITRSRPDLLQPYKEDFLNVFARIGVWGQTYKIHFTKKIKDALFKLKNSTDISKPPLIFLHFE